MASWNSGGRPNRRARRPPAFYTLRPIALDGSTELATNTMPLRLSLGREASVTSRQAGQLDGCNSLGNRGPGHVHAVLALRAIGKERAHCCIDR
jgi:hypothetical protein